MASWPSWINPIWRERSFQNGALRVVAMLLVFGASLNFVSQKYFLGMNFYPESCIKGGRLLVIDKSEAGRLDGFARGDVAAFRNEVFVKTYGKSVIGAKYVAALPGDAVQIKAGEIYINGRWWGPLALVDAKKVPGPVERYNASYSVPKGNVLILGTSAKSYDGRYWGLVNESEIIGRAVIVL